MGRFLVLLVFCVNVFLVSFGGVMYASGPDDWLKEAYTKSHEPGDGEPYSIKAEARDLFDTKIDLGKTVGNVIKGEGGVALSDSIFVRMTRFLMRIAVVLAVPVLLFVGVKVILAFGDEGKMKEALKQIGYVLGGLFLALISVMLIYLATSLTRSSVDSFTGGFIFIVSHVYNL